MSPVLFHGNIIFLPVRDYYVTKNTLNPISFHSGNKSSIRKSCWLNAIIRPTNKRGQSFKFMLVRPCHFDPTVSSKILIQHQKHPSYFKELFDSTFFQKTKIKNSFCLHLLFFHKINEILSTKSMNETKQPQTFQTTNHLKIISSSFSCFRKFSWLFSWGVQCHAHEKANHHLAYFE